MAATLARPSVQDRWCHNVVLPDRTGNRASSRQHHRMNGNLESCQTARTALSGIIKVTVDD